MVGTLLALLVFFALFGVFLTQYVPLWMSENEQSLTSQMEVSLAELKNGIDGQVASGGPAVVSTPFPLSSQSIPLISQPTVATITFVPPSPGSGTYSNVSMRPAPGATGAGTIFYENVSMGTLQIAVPSRYYSPQTFSLENDAVVEEQGTSQQVIEFPPTLSVNQTGSGYGVTESIVELTGIATQATGVGTQEAFSHFVFSQTFTSTSATDTLNAQFTEGTFYPCAWSAFVASTFAQAPSGFTSSHYTTTAPSSCASTLTTSYPFKVAFTDLASFTLIYAEVRLVIGVGTE